MRWLAALLLCNAFVLARAQAQPELLEAERAFSFSARVLDARTLEARFTVAPGYYLYREKLHFTVEPNTLASAPAFPAGEFKHDEFFGRVETYRGQIAVTMPLNKPVTGQEIVITAESQGCADVGVCYPPQRQRIALPVPRAGVEPGPVVEAVPPKRSWFK